MPARVIPTRRRCAEVGPWRSMAGPKTGRSRGWWLPRSVAYAGSEVVQTAPAGVPGTIPTVGGFYCRSRQPEEARSAWWRGLSPGVARHRLKLPCLPLVVPGNGEVLPRYPALRSCPLVGAGLSGDRAHRVPPISAAPTIISRAIPWRLSTWSSPPRSAAPPPLLSPTWPGSTLLDSSVCPGFFVIVSSLSTYNTQHW